MSWRESAKRSASSVDLRQEPDMGNLYVRIRAGVGSDLHSYRDKILRSSFDGADGVVVQLPQIVLTLSNHPVSGNKVAIASFPWCQRHPL